MENSTAQKIKNTACCVFFVIVAVALLALGQFFDRKSKFEGKAEVTAGEPYIEISSYEDEVLLVGSAVQEYMQGGTSAEVIYNKYSVHGRPYSMMEPIFNYAIYDIPSDEKITKQRVLLSLNKDLSDAKVYNIDIDARDFKFGNLFVNSKYYFELSITLSNGKEVKANGDFKTAQSPRIICIDNVWNTRDVGGMKTVDGKTVKQGLLYRGTELDGAIYEKYVITDLGKDTMLNDLKIKKEIDLRWNDNNKIRDMLGEGVDHTVYRCLAYEPALSDGPEAMRWVFSDLAKEESYPGFVHCTYGADRTGTVCHILQLLLGVDEKLAYQHWELSVLSGGSSDYPGMEGYLTELKKYPGKTMQQKAENYLLSIGVTNAEISKIKSIFLED